MSYDASHAVFALQCRELAEAPNGVYHGGEQELGILRGSQPSDQQVLPVDEKLRNTEYASLSLPPFSSPLLALSLLPSPFSPSLLPSPFSLGPSPVSLLPSP
eukprot:2285381-Rhodomonas_salina.1